MYKGKLNKTIVNMVIDMPVTVGLKGDVVMVHEEFGQTLEVSTESKPSLTFYIQRSDLEQGE